MSNEKILIITSDKILEIDAQNMLRKLGYSVSLVNSYGSDAVKKVEGLHPDLVLIDITLSGGMDINMANASQQLREMLNIPLIYLADRLDDITSQQIKVRASYEYLCKPFKERELHAAIEMALYRDKLEKRLKEAEIWRATMLKGINQGVIIVDKNRLVEFMNPAAEAWRF